MFLKTLYKHNKWLFCVFVCFAVVQIFINVKRGMTSTPFFHYAMYSGPFEHYSVIDVFEVEVNSNKLNLISFQSKNADRIIEPLAAFYQLDYSNQLYFSHIKRFLAPLHLPYDSSAFISHLSKGEFTLWYKKYLSRILAKEVNELKVFRNTYLIHGFIFQLEKQSLVFYDDN